MRLLVVEDEEKTAAYLQRGLEENGFVVDVARRGDDGLHMARTVAYDAVVLDVMLPGLDGWAVVTAVRQDNRQTPVLFLTAKDAVDDRVKGLELGADDYLVKPFAFEELLARIEALLRRPRDQKPAANRTLGVGGLELDRATLRVTRDGQEITLTARELALLELFLTAPGRVLSRERILSNVWGVDEDPLTNVVDVYVRRLRAKVDPPGAASFITTVRGLGYRLEPRPSLAAV